MSKEHNGRDLATWLMLYDRRAERLKKLIGLNAPPVIVSNEANMLRDAIEALEVMCGDKSMALEVKDLTDRTTAVIRLAIMKGRYDDSNPDVGMGPTPSMLVDDALKELGWDKSTVAYDECVKEVTHARSRRRGL